MHEDLSTKKIFNKKIDIDYKNVQDFYSDRAKRYNHKTPLTSVNLQDQNPLLAENRDKYEKKLIIPYLNLKSTDTVLDIGCGIGRWCGPIVNDVAYYHGIDSTSGLVDIARDTYKNHHNVSFQVLNAKNLSKQTISYKDNFTLIIIAGLFIYLNDRDVKHILSILNDLCNTGAKILIIDPIGIEKRLSLQNIWSDELQCNYSAIYRTLDDWQELFDPILMNDFCLEISHPLFQDAPHLNNRKETQKHLFLLIKK